MRRTLLFLALTAALTGPGLSQSARDASPTDIPTELRRIHGTLDEVRQLLAQQSEILTLRLLLERSDLIGRDITDLELQIRSLEDAARNQVVSLERMEEGYEQMAETEGVTQKDLERFARQIENERTHQESYRKENDRRLEELRARLAERQRELREWEDLLGRKLQSVQL